MLIRELLARKGQIVVTITKDAGVREAIEMLADSYIGAVAVSEDGRHVEGIISERDIVEELRLQGPEALEFQVGEVMTEDVITCNSGDKISDVVESLDLHRIRHMPVLDGEGCLEGMISIRDVVELRLKDLEQEVTILNRQLTARV